MIYLFVLFITIFLGVVFSAHFLLFRTLVLFFNITDQKYQTILKIAFAILPLGFIIASILIARFTNALTKVFYTITAIWLGLLFYFFFACLLIYFSLFLSRIFSFNINSKILTISLLLAAVAITVYGLISAQNIKIRKFDIALPNLPNEWKNKNAVFISDLHLGRIENYEFASQVAKLVDNLHPDLLFIGGDFYDGQDNVNLLKLANYFSAINAPGGKFFITGNHEELGNNAKFIKALTEAGIKNLNNEMININGLQLIGVDYKTAYSKKDFTLILENLKINKNQPSILLRHVPDKIEVAAKAGISLMLCGHAHKGQLFPVQYIETLLYNGFHYGLKNSGQTAVYTSSGVGTWGPPMRILADPEIVQFTFK